MLKPTSTFSLCKVLWAGDLGCGLGCGMPGVSIFMGNAFGLSSGGLRVVWKVSGVSKNG